MTDFVRTKVDENLRPKRPKFRLSGAVGWLLFPGIDAVLGPTQRADGSFPLQVRRLANEITIFRGVLMHLMAALFAWAAICRQTVFMVIILTVVAVLFLLDGLDGEVARYTKAQSQWGARWDPIFDKLAGISLMFWWLVLIYHFDRGQFAVSLWLVIVRAFFDLILAVIAEMEDRRDLKPKAGPWGKIKATFDDFSMLAGYAGIIIYSSGGSGHDAISTGQWLLLAACTFAPLSIWEHLRSLWRRRRTA